MNGVAIPVVLPNGRVLIGNVHDDDARLAALAEGASELELAPYEAIAILAG